MADELGKDKAQRDLEAAQKSVGKVADLEAQIRDLLGEGGATPAPGAQAEVHAEAPAVADAAGVQEAAVEQNVAPVEGQDTEPAVEQNAAPVEGQDAASVDEQPLGHPRGTFVGQAAQQVHDKVEEVKAQMAADQPQVAANQPQMPAEEAPVQAQPEQFQQQPVPDSAGAQQPVQDATGAQQGYWQGFVPVEATTPAPVPQQAAYLQSGQPGQPGVPPQPGQPGVPPQSFQPQQQLQWAQPGQPAPAPYTQQPAQPQAQPGQAPQVQPGQVQPGQMPPMQRSAQMPQGGYAQPAQPTQPTQLAPAQPTQPTQPAPAQPTQPGQPAPAPAAQPTQPAPAPYAQAAPGQPAAPQAQPAGYSQAYTPQIQQPSPYVSAQDFTVQPQPNTPAYTKSNRSTLAIVLVVVLAIIGIIAAAVIGRILTTQTTDNDNPMIEQLQSIEQDIAGGEGSADSSDNSSYYSDHNDGGSAPDSNDSAAPNSGDNTSHEGNNGSVPPGSYPDDPDMDDPFNLNFNGQEPDHGAVHIYGGGIDADDGELHDAWNKNVAYSYSEEKYDREGIETVESYKSVIGYDFDIEYPQLTGDIPNLDTINETIRTQAMMTVETAYTNPTSDMRTLVETYKQYSWGIPTDVDAIVESDVDYAITYNNEDFISICFSDERSLGSWAGGSIELRTVNVNLKTGQIYTIDDVLTLNDEIAAAFIDNLSTYDSSSAEKAAGRDNLIGAIQGKGTAADDVTSTFFIDGNGKVNLGASYFLIGEDASAAGWWDYTLTDAQLDAAKKAESDIWELIK